MMRNPVGLVWIPFLRSPSAVSPVPHIAFSVTPTAITILRVMQWMAVVLCCASLSEDAKSLHVEPRKLLIIQECMNVLPRRQQVIARTKSVDRGAVGSNFLYKDAA